MESAPYAGSAAGVFSAVSGMRKSVGNQRIGYSDSPHGLHPFRCGCLAEIVALRTVWIRPWDIPGATVGTRCLHNMIARVLPLLDLFDELPARHLLATAGVVEFLIQAGGALLCDLDVFLPPITVS